MLKRFAVRGHNGDLNVVGCGEVGPSMPEGEGSTFEHRFDAEGWAKQFRMEVVEIEVEDDRNAVGWNSSKRRAEALANRAK